MQSLENEQAMISDPTKVEFLEFCRQVLKGEQPQSSLPVAISTARNNLKDLKNGFLSHVATLTDAVREKTRNEVKEAEASIDAYSAGVDIIESFLKDQDRTTLVRGMELVRRSLERVNLAFYRYRVSVLASTGPTDMPNYNLFVSVIEDYKNRRIEQKDLLNLFNAARLSVDRAMGAIDRFRNINEVERLYNAFQKHQESITTLEQTLTANQPLEKPLEIFRERCEAIRDLQGPAQSKILSQGPTPSETANRMINVSRQLLTGRLHPYYFAENLKQLEGEYSFFKRQFHTLRSSTNSIDSDMLRDAFKESESGMDLYEKAIQEFHTFQERMETGILINAVRILQDAVLKLYNVFKLVSELADREGKVLCFHCQHYNAPERKNCEKCGAVLPRIMEEQKDLSSREVRDALLSMPITENIKNILEAGEGASQGALAKPEFVQAVARFEEIVEKNVKLVDDTRRSESKKRQSGFTDAEEEAYGLFQAGVQEMREGLSQYKQFAEKEDPNLIREGSKRIVLGAHKVYQVGRVVSAARPEPTPGE